MDSIKVVNQATPENPNDKRFLGLKTDPVVFLVATGFIIVFVIGTIIAGQKAQVAFSNIAGGLLTNLGWMYIGGVSLAFLFLIAVSSPASAESDSAMMTTNQSTPSPCGLPCFLLVELARC